MTNNDNIEENNSISYKINNIISSDELTCPDLSFSSNIILSKDSNNPKLITSKQPLNKTTEIYNNKNDKRKNSKETDINNNKKYVS